jgi:hypothetical protein
VRELCAIDLEALRQRVDVTPELLKLPEKTLFNQETTGALAVPAIKIRLWMKVFYTGCRCSRNLRAARYARDRDSSRRSAA